ncbi:MAG: molybdopterin-dependent oxidoreductase [Clostridiales bacterium]|nr:molybdopterin-dependent oxidoreductase [Clostridiales bacterium]
MNKYVNQPVMKTDAMALVKGKPVYVNDIAPKDCLIVKVLRSPHAHALIEEIQTEKAFLVKGIEGVYTYKDVPQNRFTLAGQTYPEPSPYDRLILDRRVRFVGDPVAIVAGTDEASVDKALKMIKVKYQVLEAVLDPHEALDGPILVHPEDNWRSLADVGADNKRNLCSKGSEEKGEIEKVLADSDIVVDHVYRTKANQQAMMETFRTYTYMDHNGRLNIVSSTQIVFHVRRVIANALNIPKHKIRVTKPRIGGGFGAKQTSVSEVYPAFVTWMTGKPAKMIFSRVESQIASSPRHAMEIHVRVGADKTGKLKAIDVYTLSNTGAYGEHGPTTVGLSGHKTIPLYRDLEAYRFAYDVVYTNRMSAGAYRGYGATQGCFAVESAINELAARLQIDPLEIRLRNMVREGDVMPAYYGETATSCALDKCLLKAKELMNWDEKFPCKDMGNGKVRSVGAAMTMQGSGISGVDVGSATLKINDEGFYTLLIGSADMGTGCDTILAQIAAECMECDLENITVRPADTDTSPYDSGSYASSTTYVTGKAVEKASEKMREKIMEYGAQLLNCTAEELEFDGKKVKNLTNGEEKSLGDLAYASQCGFCGALEVTVSHSSPVSPPPFMVGMAEIELDKETGAVEMVNFVGVVDCGTPINPHLARVQTEGGIGQGIGMALFEDVRYSEKGKVWENSLMQYKIPCRQDVGRIQVEFESSYEQTGPFGAKSIGEVVINTPAPAIAHAIYNATGHWFRELPITPEKILMKMIDSDRES